jgi:predicted DCC family thiol-disulfide oxidoreductase YuxK
MAVELNHDEQQLVTHAVELERAQRAGTRFVSDAELAQAQQVAHNMLVNAELRTQRLHTLRATEEQRRTADRDAALAPVKATEQRRWLAEHPGHTAADFERDAWPHLRANLDEQGRADTVEAEKARLRASGTYSPY